MIYNFIEKAINATAWKMEPPKPYGAFHITFFFVGLTVCVLLAYILRHADEKKNRAVLLTVGIFLFISELYKQLFYTIYIGGGLYQWWIFPFQLCSVPMYMCIIAAFLPECTVKRYMYNFMFAFNLMGGFVSFLEPSGLIHQYWTLTLHAFLWHMTLVFTGLYLFASGRAGVKKKDFAGTAVTFSILCAVAFVINLIFWEISAHDINMFYVGPANSPIIVFKTISEKYGWYINTPIYMTMMTAGAAVFYFGLYNAKKLCMKIKMRSK